MRALGGQAGGRRQWPAVRPVTLVRAVVRIPDMILSVLPMRYRRAAEKLERRPGMRAGHLAAGGFLCAATLYGLIGGGHVARLTESVLVAGGIGVSRIEISGHQETPELAILEQLDLGANRSLATLNVHKARARIAELPWVGEASVRKTYPDTLHVTIKERIPYALWQHNKHIYLIDDKGGPIVTFADPRFGHLPLVVGAGANVAAPAFLAKVRAHERLASRMRAGVLVAERRWNLVMANGITVKLPEIDIAEALEQLAVLDAVDGLLSRDVTVVDLRLADRITVRLPDNTAETRKARNAAEIKRLIQSGART